jgi:hypothetical protein
VPSFRVIVAVGRLRAGVDPRTVEPSAADAARELAVVEASSVDVVAGEARITIRFTEDDVRLALGVAEHTVSRMAQLAEIAGWRLTERVGGRWFRRA